MAYGPLPGWLRAEPLRAVRHRVDPVWLSETARLLPEILSKDAAVSPPGAFVESSPRRLWEGLARSLLAAPQPLLLVIDDLHWCDSATLEWLGYLLRLDEKARLLVLGTARPEETGRDHPLHALLHQLRTTGSALEVDVPPLDANDVVALAEQMRAQPPQPSLAPKSLPDDCGQPALCSGDDTGRRLDGG